MDAKRIVHRQELSDGRVAVVQRVGRSYVCYVVGAGVLDPPEYLAEGRLAVCRDAYLSCVADDILDVC